MQNTQNNNVIYVKDKKPFSIWPIVGIFVVILLLFGIPSAFYSVQPQEDAVVLRFGKYIRTEGPGLHFKLPLGVETIIKVPARTILKMEFGFRTLRGGVRTKYDSSDSYNQEGFMLTGDLNVAIVSWTVQYRVSDTKAYLFNVRNVNENIRAFSESVMHQVVGDLDINEVLTYGKKDMEEKARKLLQEILNNYKLGVQITSINLQDVLPPPEVGAAFNEVNEAKQESDRVINEAWKAYNKVIPEAQGKSSKTIADAEGYAVETVNKAKGDVARFVALEKEYAKAPEITKKRLYLDAIQEVLKKVDQIYVIDPALQSMVPLLNLGSQKNSGGKNE